MNKSKNSFKKSLIILCLLSCVFIFSLLLLFKYEYSTYMFNNNKKINDILIILKEKYPDISDQEITKVLNNDSKLKSDILKDLGIDIRKDSISLENERMEKIFSNINLIFLSSCFIIFIILFVKYNKSNRKKIKEITKSIEEINRRNYKINIDDNDEDELSILKNEIYKTTIMLNEVASNAKQDKKNLKESLSNISHQLKTPLTSITVMLDNILEDPLMKEDVKREFIKDIRREITNITFLVQALLKLSRFDANVIKFNKRSVLLEDVINASVKNVATLCDLKNININIHGNKKEVISCDFKWQVEAITNILKNCVEHSTDNSVINVSYEKNKIYKMIVIEDNGEGIEKEDLPHIFERFFKARNSKKESVGIGLSLAKKIIEQENGSITASSKIGKGTKFVIKYYE